MKNFQYFVIHQYFGSEGTSKNESWEGFDESLLTPIHTSTPEEEAQYKRDQELAKQGDLGAQERLAKTKIDDIIAHNKGLEETELSHIDGIKNLLISHFSGGNSKENLAHAKQIAVNNIQAIFDFYKEEIIAKFYKNKDSQTKEDSFEMLKQNVGIALNSVTADIHYIVDSNILTNDKKQEIGNIVSNVAHEESQNGQKRYLIDVINILDWIIDKNPKKGENSVELRRQKHEEKIKDYYKSNIKNDKNLSTILSGEQGEKGYNINNEEEFYIAYQNTKLPPDILLDVSSHLEQQKNPEDDAVNLLQTFRTPEGRKIWDYIKTTANKNLERLEQQQQQLRAIAQAYAEGRYADVIFNYYNSPGIIGESTNIQVSQNIVPEQGNAVLDSNFSIIYQSDADIKDALQGGEIVAIPLNSVTSSEKMNMLLYLDNKKSPIINLYGNEFPVPKNLQEYNDFKAYWNLLGETASLPIFTNFFKTRPEESLQYIQKRFEQKYPTEKIGANNDHFYDILFTVLGEAIGDESIQNMNSEKIKLVIDKWIIPENIQKTERILRERGIIEENGSISETSVKQSALKIKLQAVQKESEKEQQESRKQAEEILEEKWPL